MQFDRLLYSFTLLLLLVGCAQSGLLSEEKPLAFREIQQGYAIYPPEDAQLSTIQWFAERNVIVSMLNNQLNIIMPSDDFFDPIRHVFKTNAYPAIQEVADLLKQYAPNRIIVITAYTDALMSPDRQRQVSQKIGDHVAALFLERGIAYHNLEVETVSSKKPGISKHYHQADHLNRRVEIRVVLQK